MKQSIFKAYDIRGVYPDELNEKAAYQIGQAFVKYLKAKNVLAGADARTSSPSLQKALVRGITDAGANVILAGKLTTPMFYFAVAQSKGCDGGIMVTASHNPAKYNGFKLVDKTAMPIEPAAIAPLIAGAEVKAAKKGGVSKINIEDAYVKKVLSLASIKKIKPMKIAIDAGNGMAGNIAEKLFKKIPQVKIVPLFFKTDMSFPNHEANPLKEETLQKLKETISKSKANLGVAYDGDADRVGFVDEKGNFMRADFVFSAILPEIFAKHPAAPVLYDLRSSKIAAEEIKRLGGKPKMTRVGHAFIKKQLRCQKAAAAAEISCHFYFQDFYGVECSDLVIFYLLAQMSKTKKTASELISPFAKYFQSGEINFSVKDKNKIISKIIKKYRPTAKKFSNLDGIRMEFKEGRDWFWFNLRPSNTEPLLRLNMEASGKTLLEKKLSELSKIIKA